MSYPAPTALERRAIDTPPLAPCDPVLARMAEVLRIGGRLEIWTPDGEATAEVVERTRLLLMGELCEPVRAARVAGGLVFTREWGGRR